MYAPLQIEIPADHEKIIETMRWFALDATADNVGRPHVTDRESLNGRVCLLMESGRGMVMFCDLWVAALGKARSAMSLRELSVLVEGQHESLITSHGTPVPNNRSGVARDVLASLAELRNTRLPTMELLRLQIYLGGAALKSVENSMKLGDASMDEMRTCLSGGGGDKAWGTYLVLFDAYLIAASAYLRVENEVYNSGVRPLFDAFDQIVEGLKQ